MLQCITGQRDHSQRHQEITSLEPQEQGELATKSKQLQKRAEIIEREAWRLFMETNPGEQDQKNHDANVSAIMKKQIGKLKRQIDCMPNQDEDLKSAQRKVERTQHLIECMGKPLSEFSEKQLEDHEWALYAQAVYMHQAVNLQQEAYLLLELTNQEPEKYLNQLDQLDKRHQKLQVELNQRPESTAGWRSITNLQEKYIGQSTHIREMLADCYYKQGEYIKAAPLYQEVLAFQERTFYYDHSDIVQTREMLADCYYKQGKYTEAEPLYQDALAFQESTLDRDHLDIVRTRKMLADCYYMQNKYAQAASLYSSVQSSRIWDHPDTTQIQRMNTIEHLIEDNRLPQAYRAFHAPDRPKSEGEVSSFNEGQPDKKVDWDEAELPFRDLMRKSYEVAQASPKIAQEIAPDRWINILFTEEDANTFREEFRRLSLLNETGHDFCMRAREDGEVGPLMKSSGLTSS